MTDAPPTPSLANRLLGGIMSLGMVGLGGWGAAWGLSRSLDGVEVDPGDPPHAQVVFICSLLVLGGLFSLFKSVKPAAATPVGRQRQVFATVLVSLLILGALLIPAFDPSVQAVWAEALGPRPLGVAPTAAAVLLMLVAYLPMPAVFWHLMGLGFARLDREQGMSKGGLVGEAVSSAAGGRRSGIVVMAGLAYVVGLMVAWIVYAEMNGL